MVVSYYFMVFLFFVCLALKRLYALGTKRKAKRHWGPAKSCSAKSPDFEVVICEAPYLAIIRLDLEP